MELTKTQKKWGGIILVIILAAIFLPKLFGSGSSFRGRGGWGRRGRGRTVIYGGGWGGYPYNWFDPLYYDAPYSNKCVCGTDKAGREITCQGVRDGYGRLNCGCC